VRPAYLLRDSAANPASPAPRRSRLEGSGTGAAKTNAALVQFSPLKMSAVLMKVVVEPGAPPSM